MEKNIKTRFSPVQFENKNFLPYLHEQLFNEGCLLWSTKQKTKCLKKN